jgi:hypothetical protein
MSHAAKSAEFSLYPSRYTLIAQLGLAISAALVVAISPILLIAKLSGLLILLAAGIGFSINFCRQNPERLFVVDGDCWRLISSSGNLQHGGEVAIDLQLEPSQFVTAGLVILYFRTPQGRRLNRVIPRDSLSPEEHRILRKLLLATTNRD